MFVVGLRVHGLGSASICAGAAYIWVLKMYNGPSFPSEHAKLQTWGLYPLWNRCITNTVLRIGCLRSMHPECGMVAAVDKLSADRTCHHIIIIITIIIIIIIIIPSPSASFMSEALQVLLCKSSTCGFSMLCMDQDPSRLTLSTCNQLQAFSGNSSADTLPSYLRCSASITCASGLGGHPSRDMRLLSFLLKQHTLGPLSIENA